MMTVHVLHAGDGYAYLTRQVASGDVVRAKGDGLTDYYAASGNPPGRWVGAGCSALGVAGVVDEEQMKALFGEGRHPLTNEIAAQMIAEGATVEQVLQATLLGRKMPVFANDRDHFDKWVDAAFARFEKDHGRLPEAGVEADLVRYDVARKYLAQEHPGQAIDDIAVRKFFAERGAKTRQPVSGYDLVFTPPKSVSVMWGLSDRGVSRVIEEAHDAAWRQSLAWLESEAALTRKGAGGLSQINTGGFVATAFDHIDSRAGDPNLHTHVAVANRVLGADGKWRALDARALHHFAVAASERYNLLIEQELTKRLGLAFEDVYTRRGAQAVREIVGVPKELREVFSRRSRSIEATLDELVNEYKARHGVMPDKVTQVRLAQEATIATRPRKEEGVTLLTRREQWLERAAEVLGGDRRVRSMVNTVLGQATDAQHAVVDVEDAARTVVQHLEVKRARWNRAHVAAEATRVVRQMARGQVVGEGVVDQVTEAAYNTWSVSLEAPEMLERPALLSRADGSSVFRAHGAQWRTSLRVMDREDALLTAGRTAYGPVFDPGNVALISEMSMRPLDAGQLAVAQRFVSSGRLLDAAIGPAGTGKTTAMRAFARGVEMGGGKVVALAPSAVAAKVLGDEIGVGAETVAKFLLTQEGLEAATAERARLVMELRQRGKAVPQGLLTPKPHPMRLDAGTIILVDEAGMTDAADIERIVTYAKAHDASVRLIGDPAQLDAVTGAGALRMFDREIGAGRLSTIHRFTDMAERDTTVKVRDGDVSAAEFYIERGRVTGGTHDETLNRVYDAWQSDLRAGANTVMIAYSNDDVATLSQRAQRDLVDAGVVTLTDVELHNGSHLGVGDVIVTRRNDRETVTASGDFVKNGDVWHVDSVDKHGRATAIHLETGEAVVLQRQYLEQNVELAYASTIHRVQGRTVDLAHIIVTDAMTREQLYVALTRGRHGNFLYIPTDQIVDADGHTPVPDSDSAAAVLRRAIVREGAEMSALETLQRDIEAHESLDTMLDQYEHVLGVHAPLVDHDHVRDVVMRAFGGHGHYVIDDHDAWPEVARTVTALEQSGADPVGRLNAAVRVEQFAGDGSPGRLVLERIGEIGPGRRVAVDELNPWLEGMEQRIAARLATDELVTVPKGRNLRAIREAWGVAAPAPKTVDEVLELDTGVPPQDMAPATLSQRVDVLTTDHGPKGPRVESTDGQRPSLQQRVDELSRQSPRGPGADGARHLWDLAKELDRRDGPEQGL